MEPPPAAELAAQSTMLCLFAGSSSYQDPDVIELTGPSTSSWSLSNQKRRRTQVVPREVIDVDKDDDPEVMFIDGSSLDYKDKQSRRRGKDLEKQVKKPVRDKSSRMQPQIVIEEDEIDLKFKAFKQFDTVQGNHDHYYANPENVKGIRITKKTSKDWAKRIQHEWKVLEKDLPETIFVRVYEDRMDILRAVIIGPAGTPYHDGLFFFDVYFPPNYPNSPPMVHYHAGGLRLNPNLYACGKVCLSLLGTWSGNGCEKWNASKSTMLQVLVSIQALVLNAKPYFNEPGFVGSENTEHGKKNSFEYNENTFLLSCKTMLYSLRRPPKHFEDFVAGHFRKRGRPILVACRAYLDGAQVGCLAGGGVQDVDEGDKSCSPDFRKSLNLLFNDLLKEFKAKGADCDGFLPHQNQDRIINGAADTTLRL
ncbi:putative ubiquitin-conjugating enzyme E2 38 isoform X1 [Asparagus officinalis]|uniref:putative ubiquitin-conjugating enzyme E2 38 isoform X1 n=1 Tax=Asparagus officinalis TaxID=4686 RepID=UPI00098E4C7C|nr:putative ubiquitin-conjugating enzyme E2 38 isoform X1 [Asparagus officinalis]